MSRKSENRNNTDTSRRSFVKNSAIAAASFMIVPRHVLGGKDFKAPSDRLIIAGVGAGGKGNDDINRFYKSGKADIGFLCDVDERRCATTVRQFPNAKVYKDWRELFDKESKNFDAVSVSTPDHTHAIVGMGAMQLGKHVWIQKPMAHDIYEARELTKAAERYKVVTQMGNQGASGDGVRQMKEWFEAGLLGDVHTIEVWTNRPIWPQGIPWPSEKPPVPKGLDWDLWIGTAPYKDYVDKLIPQAWRGWWDYGTGALGDLGCHLMEAPFNILNLKYAKDVQATVGSVYSDWGKRVNAPDSPPPSAHATLTFPKTDKTKGDITMHWMDGGIRPMRPVELGNDELFGDGMSGVLFIGTKGKMMASEMAQNARLLPLSKNRTVKLKQTIKRVPGGMDGHYAQWVEGAIAGYGKMEMSASFDKSGPLTEAILMANLAIRGAAIYQPGKQTDPFDQSINYPGANKKLIWDNANMRITNYDVVNQFVKREYRKGWSLGV